MFVTCVNQSTLPRIQPHTMYMCALLTPWNICLGRIDVFVERLEQGWELLFERYSWVKGVGTSGSFHCMASCHLRLFFSHLRTLHCSHIFHTCCWDWLLHQQPCRVWECTVVLCDAVENVKKIWLSVHTPACWDCPSCPRRTPPWAWLLGHS